MSLVTIITGASSGIGKACALALAGPGQSLVLCARSNADGLKEVAQAAENAGARVTTLLLDLSEAGSSESLIKAAQEVFGQVDQIVSNAGHAKKGTMCATTNAELNHAFELNTLPFLDLVRTAKSDLAASECGRVVAVSSFVANHYGVNGTLFPTTSASKAALVSLAKSLAFEMAPDGVTVNCVAPGYTEKEGNRGTLDRTAWQRAADAAPNGRLAKPADIAEAITFFLSEGAGHITGQVLNVDGGLSLR